MVTSFLNRFAPINFDGYIDRLTDRFTGREWLFEQHIDPWLQQQGKEQFYLLTGEPGVGKSAIVAQLVKRWKAQSQDSEQGILAGKLAAYHFCRAGDVETVRPGRVLRSIAAQLGETLPHYGKALNKVLEQVHLNIDVNINIDRLTNSQVTGIYIENLKDLDPREELRLLIQAPLAALPAIYEEAGTALPQIKVFLIDSLDEAVTTTGRDNVATLLAALSQTNDLPPWIRFILTARPGILKANAEGGTALQFEALQHYELEKLLEENLTDIEWYITRRVHEEIERPKVTLMSLWQGYREFQKKQPEESEKFRLFLSKYAAHLITRSNQPQFSFQKRLEQAELSVETLMQQVKDLSKGNFLYTRLVMNGVSTGELSLKNLSALPKNLNEVYQRFLRHRCPVRKWVHLYQPILGTLTVTQEAISTAQLTKFAGIASKQIEGEAQVESAIGILRQFLYEVEDEQGQKLYTIFHQSLREYLLDRKYNHDFWCDAKEQHDNIIKCCEQESKNWEDLRAIDLYGLRHLAQHLVKGDRGQQLHTLLSIENSRQQNGWFDAKEHIGDTSGFLTDVKLAWALTDEEFHKLREGSAVGLQCRYALINASVNSLASNIPPLLLLKLTKKKVWSPSQALVYAKGNWQILRELASYLPEPYKKAALQDCIQAVETNPYEEFRANDLADLAPYLSEDLLPRLLQAANGIENDYYRGKVIEAVAPYLTEPLFLHGLQVAQAIKKDLPRAMALAVLAKYQPEVVLPLVFQAIQNVKRVIWGRVITEIITKMVSHLPESILSDVLQGIKNIQDEGKQAEALTALIPSLSNDLLVQVFQTVQAMDEEGARSESLIALVPYLPQMLLLDVLKMTQDFKDDWQKEKLITSLVSHLPRNFLPKVLQVTQSIHNEAHRAKALITLIPHLPKVLPKALKVAQAIDDAWSRAEVLVALAPYTPEVVSQALQAIQGIKQKWKRIEILVTLAPYIPKALSLNALQMLYKLGDKRYKLKPHELKQYQLQGWKALTPHLSKTHPAEALQFVCSVNEESDRTERLVALAPHIPETWLSKTLHIAQSIQHEPNRATALEALAPRLSESSLILVLETAQDINDQSSRLKVLLTLASHLPKTDLPEILHTVQSLQEHWRSDALVEMLKYLPVDLLPQVINLTQSIQEEKYRVNLLAKIANYLSQDLILQVVNAARLIHGTEYRAEVLVALATRFTAVLPETFQTLQSVRSGKERGRLLAPLIPHLSKEQLLQALHIIQHVNMPVLLGAAPGAFTSYLSDNWLQLLENVRTSQRRSYQTWLLVTFSKIPKDLFPQTLQLALEIPNIEKRAEALAALVPYDSNTLLPQALQLALEIPSIEKRAEALAALVPYDSNILPLVLEVIQTIKFEASKCALIKFIAPYLSESTAFQVLQMLHIVNDGWFRISTLAEVTPYLPQSLLSEVLQVAQAIDDEHHRAKVLVSLAPHLPKNGLYQILEIAKFIKDAKYRVDVLISLIPYFPEAIPSTFKSIPAIQNSYSWSEALLSFLPHLSEAELPLVLQIIASNKHQDYHAKVFAALASRLPEELLLQGLQISNSITEERYRVEALVSFLQYLPQKLLERVLQSIQLINNEIYRADGLVALTPYFPEIASQALQSIQILPDYLKSKVFKLIPYLSEASLIQVLDIVKVVPNEQEKANLLKELACCLPDFLLSKITQIVQTIQRQDYQVEVLIALSQRLPESLTLALQISQSMPDGYPKVFVTVMLIPYIPEALSLTIHAVQAIRRVDAYREEEWAKVMKTIIPYLEKFLPSNSSNAWTEFLHILGNNNCEHLLRDIQTLAPVIHALGREKAIEEVLYAIYDVERWWL